MATPTPIKPAATSAKTPWYAGVEAFLAQPVSVTHAYILVIAAVVLIVLTRLI